MVGEIWDFDDTHGISDSQSMCSTSNSEDSIVDSKNGNIVDIEISNINIDDQLRMITEKKHQEYLLNTGCKSLSSKITRNNENTKDFIE